MNEEQMKYVANLMSQDLEKDKEIARLNNIIDELVNWLRESRDGERKEKSRLIQYDKSIEPIIYNNICLYDKILGIIKALKEGKQ
jgi:hypothetical protein